MREIKFRAWDIEDKTMIPSDYNDDHYIFHFTHGGSPELLEANWDEQPDGYHTKKALFLQYTGLTDKNGVEIYEGDIVECPDFYNYTDGSTGTVKNAVIAYCEVTAIWWVEFEGDCREMSLWSYGDLTSDLEVVGNIHENPELLGDNNEN